MDRYIRQRAIGGWNQDHLADGRVLVVGRGWLGVFVVWALASMGIGEVLWLGTPNPETDSMARWLSSTPSPFVPARVHAYPFDVEFGGEFAWVLSRVERADVIVACAEEPFAEDRCAHYAAMHAMPFLLGSAADGGSIGQHSLTPMRSAAHDRASHVIAAMAVAGLLVDAVRETLVPLAGGYVPVGPLGFEPGPGVPVGPWLVAGVGGIGSYAAVLAAALGVPLRLVDDDRVEVTNLNRQGLFRPADVCAMKVHAAAAALSHLFPHLPVHAEAARFDARTTPVLLTGTSLVLSALDNAAGRLALQAAGREAGRTVVQGSTDLFTADCFTQVDGLTLDAQMHGALSRAARAEAGAGRRREGCAAQASYVVPGMMAAAFMVHRAWHASVDGHANLSSLHWRSGYLPGSSKPLDHADYSPVHL